MNRIVWSFVLVMVLFFGCLDFLWKTPEQEYYELKEKTAWFYEEESEYYLKFVADGDIVIEVDEEKAAEQNPLLSEEELEETIEVFHSGMEKLEYSMKTELWKKEKSVKYKTTSDSAYSQLETIIVLTENEQHLCVQEVCIKSEPEDDYTLLIEEVFGVYSPGDLFLLGDEFDAVLNEEELFSIAKKGEKKEVAGRQCQEFEIEINQEYLDEVLDEVENSPDNKGLSYKEVNNLITLSYIVGSIVECVDLERGYSASLTMTMDVSEQYEETDYPFSKAEVSLEYIVKKYEENSVSDDEFEIPDNYVITESQ